MSDLEDLFGVRGKTALVTGGGAGIGRSIAEGLARGGARVMIASRKLDACEATAAELNAMGLKGTLEAFRGDVGSEEGCEALAAEVARRTDALEILVNNAGVTWGETLDDFPWKGWDRVMKVNVAGLFDLTRRLLPLLEAGASDEDPARIINLGSVMGAWPLADGTYSYSASKAAVHHLTRILAKELAGRRLTVNAFAPGPFPSRMTAFATDTDEKAAAMAKTVPLGRLGTAEDLMGAALFLSSRAGAYVTGCILPLDGGIGTMTGGDLFEAGREA
ncbi:MAG TPA: SDR family oxidoreductase [Paracoccaceae bacterium]|nr:SDR family oxidoreductase [Paracoccaceae bacterium]